MPERIRIGLVGAGRTRDGLGPWLARHAESAGGVLAAVAGRTPERTRAAAADLARDLGHPVEACGSLAELVAADCDAWIVASPNHVHEQGLRSALGARGGRGVPVLCEKPLVDPASHTVVPEICAAFLQRDLLLMENCQWPEILPAFELLYPDRRIGRGEPTERLAMGLSPSGTGPSMLVDSLSHYLSVAQALWPVGETTTIRALSFSGDAGRKHGLSVDLVLRNPDGSELTGEFHMRQCPEQPRPAWIEVNGARIDRCIDLASYQISFRTGENTVPVNDPTALLVYRFLELCREANSDRIRDESRSIANRARLYAWIVGDYVSGPE